MRINNFAEHIIEYLLYAERDVHEVRNITEEHPTLTIDDAYRLQDGLLRRRATENDTKTIGVKVCLTSKEQQKKLGIDHLIYGFLQADMLAYEWEPVVHSELIHPIVEAELAFFIADTIDPSTMTKKSLLENIAYVAPALEIADSRYKDYDFTTVDVIADNCSCAKFVIGSTLFVPNEVNFTNIGVVMMKNSEILKTGTSASVLGNPLRALLKTVHELAKREKTLSKGDIVLSGPITSGIRLEKGDTVVAKFSQLGTVTLTVN